MPVSTLHRESIIHAPLFLQFRETAFPSRRRPYIYRFSTHCVCIHMVILTYNIEPRNKFNMQWSGKEVGSGLTGTGPLIH